MTRGERLLGELVKKQSDRIKELEAACSRAYGMLAEGPATGIALQDMLDQIAKALGWNDVNREAAKSVQALANWMEE